MKTEWILSAALLLAASAGAQVADPSRGPEADPTTVPQGQGQIGTPGLETPGAQPVQTRVDDRANELAERYGFESNEVTGLRDRGYSWRETENALAIAKKAGKPLDEVVSQRDRGQSWDDIAQTYGFKLRDAKIKKGMQQKGMEHQRGTER